MCHGAFCTTNTNKTMEYKLGAPCQTMLHEEALYLRMDGRSMCKGQNIHHKLIIYGVEAPVVMECLTSYCLIHAHNFIFAIIFLSTAPSCSHIFPSLGYLQSYFPIHAHVFDWKMHFHPFDSLHAN